MSESGVYKSTSIPQPKVGKPTGKPAPSKPAPVSADVSSSDSLLDQIAIKKPRVQGVATVKSVLSGDTLILVGSSKKEKRVSLSGVVAPKIAVGKSAADKDGAVDPKTDKANPDEPFGYQAREFLRNLLVGQVVQFTLASDAPAAAGAREFADVSFKGQDLAELLLAQGYAKVSLPRTFESVKKDAKVDPKAKKDDKAAVVKKEDVPEVKLSAEKEALLKIQHEAEKKKVGMWSGAQPNTRKVDWAPDNLKWITEYRNKPLPAFIDRVLDGSTFRVEVKDPKNPKSLQHTMLTLSLAGVLAPRTAKDAKDKSKVADEAQQLSESRLLNKDVHIMIQGVDKNANLFGTILFPKGNIALRLLETGNAKYVPWTAVLTSTEDQAALAKAAEVAKAGKVGIYKDAPATTTTVGPVKEFEGTVVQVISGDCFIVRDAANVDHKVFLASINAPRLARKGTDAEAYSFEAREFLRKSLISKKVKVVVEYEREGKKDDPESSAALYVTVFKNKYNVAVELVAAGLAEVQSYSKDADRTVHYAELCQAEAVAKAEKKGKFSGKEAPAPVADLTRVEREEKEDDKKDKKVTKKTTEAPKVNVSELLKGALTKFTAQKGTAGVLDQAFAPNRLKVFNSGLHAYISVTISAVNTPQQPAKGEPRSAIYDAALAYVKQFLQQDIVFEASSLARNNSFLAVVFHKETKENLGLSLLKQGLASVNSFGVEKLSSTLKSQYVAAEAEAKKQRRGMWVDYDEEKERLAAEKARQETAESVGMGIYTKDGADYVNVVVTDVADPVHFYVNNVDDKNVALVNEKMAAFVGGDAPKDFAPAKGDILAGLFEDDNKWYRVRIEGSNAKTQTYSVQFIDFGNLASLPLASLRVLPEELAKIKQLARPCALSAVKPPLPNSEYFEQGATALANLTGGIQFAARIDFKESGGSNLLHLTLTEEKEPLSINAAMLQQGWVRIHPRPISRLNALVPELEQYELDAKDKHYGIWEYGAYTSDVDEQ